MMYAKPLSLTLFARACRHDAMVGRAAEIALTEGADRIKVLLLHGSVALLAKPHLAAHGLRTYLGVSLTNGLACDDSVVTP